MSVGFGASTVGAIRALPVAERPNRVIAGRRVSIVGPAGSGKTTLSEQLVDLGQPYVKVDNVQMSPAGAPQPGGVQCTHGRGSEGRVVGH
jgi:ABC-type dipeptide/oligopeptide/nickel transport system ATPase subunit